jgi:hypothetical protein
VTQDGIVSCHVWGKALNTFYKKFPAGTIFTNHVFSCDLAAPTTLRIKEWKDAATEQKKKFVKRGTAGSDYAKLMKQYKLEQLVEPGLWEIKQVELWVKWRKCIPPPQFRDEICPRQDEMIIERIKKEKNDELKSKKTAKKKKMEQPPTVAT